MPSHKSTPPKKAFKKALHEVFSKEPSTVTRANVSGERKKKMMVAIAFSKARKAAGKKRKS